MPENTAVFENTTVSENATVSVDTGEQLLVDTQEPGGASVNPDATRSVPTHPNPSHFILFLNEKLCCFSCIIAKIHQNSSTVDFWWEKIEGNLRRANTELSIDFRRVNTELSKDFRKANTEPSVRFMRANTETYCK